MAKDTSEERGPVKVELVVTKDDKGPSMGQKLLRLVSIGLAGGAVTAAIGSIIAKFVIPVESSDKCRDFAVVAVDQFSNSLFITQGALLAGGFLIFFVVGMLKRKKAV